MAEAGFLKAIYDSLGGYPILQAAVGALILLGGIKLMLKADKSKDAAAAVPPPAPMPTAEASQIHLQGSVAHLDIMRDNRDLLRNIAECMRIAREELRKHTELLEKIENEQRVSNEVERRMPHQH